ncbi:MAG: hypothetical protein Q4D04_09520 [Clostridia bacterium]|nr:hypothetical protein [Clostridia bacterium]
MKAAAFIAIAAILIFGAACADDSALDRVDISSMVEWARSASDMDVRKTISKLISGEFEISPESAMEDIRRIASGEIRKAARYVALLCAPCLILAALNVVYPKGDAVYTLGLVCSLAVTATLVTIFADCLIITRDFLNAIGGLNESVYPILAALLAVSGKTAASALFTPSAALAGSVVSSVIATWSPLFSGCVAALAAAGQLSSSIKLDGLEKLVRRVYNFGLAAAMTLITCLMATRGELAKGYDSSSIQTAKFTVGSLLPIVGGEVADSIDSLVASASLVKNAVGVTGIILLASVCMRPIIALGVAALVVRLSSALVQPLGKSAPQMACERFADALDMLLAACAASGVLVMIMIGASMTLFGG